MMREITPTGSSKLTKVKFIEVHDIVNVSRLLLFLPYLIHAVLNIFLFCWLHRRLEKWSGASDNKVVTVITFYSYHSLGVLLTITRIL